MPLDIESLPYQTGDTISSPLVTYRLFFLGDQWFLQAIMAALVSLTDPLNWNTVGTISPEDAASLAIQAVESFEPVVDMIGAIVPFGGAIPVGALACDGTSYLRSDYPDLFAVIGTTWGAADGTHFNVPDLRGRALVGAGTGSGLSPRALGDALGEENHQLTVGELASHVHSTGNSLILGTSAPPPLDALGPNPLPAVTGSTGGDQAHNNIQPSAVINWGIVATYG